MTSPTGKSICCAGTTSPSPIGWDLSRLGSGERNGREATGPRGPSERERASHWAGVRAEAHGNPDFGLWTLDIGLRPGYLTNSNAYPFKYSVSGIIGIIG